ncbi:hypothetical protein HOG27_01730 [bacterium]|nr:hypothetical protein [bacterium]
MVTHNIIKASIKTQMIIQTKDSQEVFFIILKKKKNYYNLVYENNTFCKA